MIQPPNTYQWIVGNCTVYVPNGTTVQASYGNPGGGGTITINCNGMHYTYNVPNVSYFTIPPNVGSQYMPAIPARSADELQDGELILALVARGYAVWKPNPEGK